MKRPPLLLALVAACREPDVGRPDPDEPTTPTTLPGRPATTTLPTAGAPAWLATLRGLPGVSIDEMYDTYDSTEVVLSFEQPVDHAAPSGPSFRQHAFLRHRDEHSPMVLSTSGYGLTYQESELGVLLKGNEIELEKRFDGTSFPDDRSDLDWSTLTPWQVASDAHHVAEQLRPLYDGAWIGTGVSNGGIDALSHRMHYPDDLAGTVAYVAPLMNSLDDDRIDAFFTDDADPTCQAAVQKLQLALLTDLWPDYLAAASETADAPRSGVTFDRVGGIERSLQLGLIEFPFVFWQFSGLGACPGVPDPDVDRIAAVDFGLSRAGYGTGSDSSLASLSTWFYEVNAYVGYPSIDVTPIAAHVDPDLVGPNPDLFLPDDAPVPTFEPLGPQLQAWLDDDAHDVILIDGFLDPFTRAAADVSRADPSVWRVTDPEGSHLAKVKDLADADAARVLDALADWTR